MTVSELIEQLEDCDPEAEVIDAHGNPIEVINEDDDTVELTSNAS